MTINFLVSIVAWVAMFVVVLFFTVPDVPVAPLMIASVVVLVVVPLWFYPRSKTLWAAIEFLVARSDPSTARPFDATLERRTWSSEGSGDRPGPLGRDRLVAGRVDRVDLERVRHRSTDPRSGPARSTS